MDWIREGSISKRARIEQFVQVAPPVLAGYIPRKDVCIRAARITHDVLEHFGVKAKPLSVTATAYNAACVRLMEQTDCQPENVGEEDWREWNAAGAYAICIGRNTT